MKFKVGDRVRFIGESTFIDTGDVGKVVKIIFGMGMTGYVVDFQRDNLFSRALGDDTWTCAEDELEVV